MEAFKEFKQLREKSGMTVREFCTDCNIGKTSYTLYSEGKSDLRDIRTETALKIFQVLNVDICSFYDKNFHYKAETDEIMKRWLLQHPRNYSYNDLKCKYRNRLATIKKRSDSKNASLQEIKNYQKEIFKDKLVAVEDGMISESDYKTYILQLSYLIRKFQSSEEEQTVLYDAMLHTDFTITELAEILDLSRIHLRRVMLHKENLSKMKIIKYLKLCYILELEPAKCYNLYDI